MYYKRILLKLSGEALIEKNTSCFNVNVIKQICNNVKILLNHGIQLGIVVGGGNICRGQTFSSSTGLKKINTDYMGMIATIINGIILKDIFNQINIKTTIYSAIKIDFIEEYIPEKASKKMNEEVIIFTGGTGNPFFTTDTAAVLKAIEMNCDLVIKATKVDGIYSVDPELDINAFKYHNISYDEVIKKDLKVMDATAICLAKENKMPIAVLNINDNQQFLNVINNQGNFSLIQ